MPVISVITPSYNCGQYLEATIKSLQAQTLTDWECIIIDDCSTDNSFDIAQELAKQDERITAVQLAKNSGSSAARNEGLRHATGRYVTFIDGDDTIKPTKFKDQLDFMEANNYLITYTNYRRMTPDEKKEGMLQRNAWRITYPYLLRHTAMGTLTPVYNRAEIGEFFFDETLPARMDWVFWLDILREGHVAYRFDQDLARYRRGHTSLSSNINKGRKLVWKILRERQGIALIPALYYYGSYIFHALKKRKQF